jgi:hypothetical protein
MVWMPRHRNKQYYSGISTTVTRYRVSKGRECQCSLGFLEEGIILKLIPNWISHFTDGQEEERYSNERKGHTHWHIDVEHPGMFGKDKQNVVPIAGRIRKQEGWEHQQKLDGGGQ